MPIRTRRAAKRGKEVAACGKGENSSARMAQQPAKSRRQGTADAMQQTSGTNCTSSSALEQGGAPDHAAFSSGGSGAAAGAAARSDADEFQPSLAQPFSDKEIQAITQSVHGATYRLSTAQVNLPYLALMVGAKFPDAPSGMRTDQLRQRCQKLANTPITALSSGGPHPPRVLTLQMDAKLEDDDWYEGGPIDVVEDAMFAQGHMIGTMHELHVYELVPESVADPAQDDSVGNARMNGPGNTATHAVWARIGTARLAGRTGQPLKVDNYQPDLAGLATLYGRPGAWTPEQVAAEQAAAETAIHAFHDAQLLDAHGRRVAGHSLNSN